MATVLQILFGLTAILSEAGTFPATVTAVHDGDTLNVIYEGRVIRIRLDSVDAPETQQAFGGAARKFTAHLALGQTVTIVERDIDRYGRTVAVVTLQDGRNLNHELVRAGYAWWYRKYAAADSELQALESEARNAGLGLWAEAAPVAPWEWRKQPRQPARGERRSARRSEPRDRGRLQHRLR